MNEPEIGKSESAIKNIENAAIDKHRTKLEYTILNGRFDYLADICIFVKCVMKRLDFSIKSIQFIMIDF